MMTRAERTEAHQLLANGMLHARMLPLLRAAMEVVERPVPRPSFTEVKPGIWEWFVWMQARNRKWKYLLGRGYHVFYSRKEAAHAYYRLMGRVK